MTGHGTLIAMHFWDAAKERAKSSLCLVKLRPRCAGRAMGRSRDAKLREAVPRVLALNHAKFVEESAPGWKGLLSHWRWGAASTPCALKTPSNAIGTAYNAL